MDDAAIILGKLWRLPPSKYAGGRLSCMGWAGVSMVGEIVGSTFGDRCRSGTYDYQDYSVSTWWEVR